MKYPIGIQSFESLRKEGYVYVDKSTFVYQLAHTGRYFFLSRPRRFGKSLLVSAMEAYFCGRKDLFEGLAISELEKEWVQYPVLRFDLTGQSYASPEALEDALDTQLLPMEKRYGVTEKAGTPASRFRMVIDAAFEKTGLPVVVLIDEYDKPIVDNLDKPELAEFFKTQLQGFYSVLKAKDDFVKFGFLTGVSKVGQLSVFSGLNNLKDISMDVRFAHICGISGHELRTLFAESVRELAKKNGMSEAECYRKLALMYDGYHFHHTSEGIYNPFSLLNTFDCQEFRKYWYNTGTPTFLVKYLAAGNYCLEEVSTYSASEQELTGVNALKPDAITLLYQTGYLTIKGYNPTTEKYTLGYPNKEVEDGFLEALSKIFAPVSGHNSDLSVDKFVSDIQSGNAEMLMRRFSAFFADMDYQIQGKAEMYFQNTMYVMLKLMGQQVDVERHTSNGRIDVLIQTPEFVYIIELKRDQDPQNALDQISDKAYDWPFSAGKRKVYKIGASFSTATRRLKKWEIR
ncbi:MAG: AAA family ATPase [Bacteroidales bacterium]|nr:AAA family ATPase [Bacteroidales bacterium]